MPAGGEVGGWPVPAGPGVVASRIGAELPRGSSWVRPRLRGLDVGLGASVWSADPDAAADVARRIEAGTVWINKHGAVDPRIPFGGIKGSGYGLEFGVEGLKSVAASKVICR